MNFYSSRILTGWVSEHFFHPEQQQHLVEMMLGWWMHSWRLCVLSVAICCCVSLYVLCPGCEYKCSSGTINLNLTVGWAASRPARPVLLICIANIVNSDVKLPGSYTVHHSVFDNKEMFVAPLYDTMTLSQCVIERFQVNLHIWKQQFSSRGMKEEKTKFMIMYQRRKRGGESGESLKRRRINYWAQCLWEDEQWDPAEPLTAESDTEREYE